jgi:hypothetical protein
MVRRALILVLLAANAAGLLAASAGAGEAKRRLTAADERRADAMLLRPADLATGFRREPERADPELSCAALDESDLIVTGDADALYTLSSADLFVRVGSSATLYRTPREATASWRRGTSAAGLACLRRELAKSAAKEGLRVSSLRRLPVSGLAPRTFVVRIVLVSDRLPVPFTYDVVVLGRGRALAAVGVLSLGAPVPARQRDGFARLVSARMAKALSGRPGGTGPSA